MITTNIDLHGYLINGQFGIVYDFRFIKTKGLSILWP